ncbi:hypothetical protein [Haloterrigena salina]|nr:hypothetical protein [Haloterrigena salina]
MAAEPVLQTGFYVVIGLAGISVFCDGLLFRRTARGGSHPALVPMFLGGIALAAIGISGVVGLAPNWIGSVTEFLPRLDRVDQFHRLATSSMLTLLLFVVLPRRILGINDSLTIRALSDAVAADSSG